MTHGIPMLYDLFANRFNYEPLLQQWHLYTVHVIFLNIFFIYSFFTQCYYRNLTKCLRVLYIFQSACIVLVQCGTTSVMVAHNGQLFILHICV